MLKESEDALACMTRPSGDKLAEAADVEADEEAALGTEADMLFLV